MTGMAPNHLGELILQKSNLLILDIRDAASFIRGHIKGAANASFATPQQQNVIVSRIPRTFKVVLVDEDGTTSARAARFLSRYGLDARHLEGGMAGWTGDVIRGNSDPEILGGDLWKAVHERDDIMILDVREPHEFAEFRIPGAVNIPLSRLFAADIGSSIPSDKKVITVCSHGNRSMVATFALAGMGVESSSLTGGMAGWNQVLAPTATISDGGLTIIQVEKVGKGCLSYVLGCGGKAAVLDPTYPASEYVSIAKDLNLAITSVADTHQHADHVSAASELARITGARLYLSAKEQYEIDAVAVSGGDSIPFGDAHLDVVHTPGHTAGSMTYVFGGRHAFCGDTLSADGIGRPDLRDRAAEYAGELHETLHKIILALPSGTRIYPAHRSADSRSDDSGTYSTTPELASKLSLMVLDKSEFVSRVAGTTQPKPMNHTFIIKINRGLMPVPHAQIPDLEMGPNRCSVRSQ